MHASCGIVLGGLLNCGLDPLFMFVIMPSNPEIGAALATGIANSIALIYYIILMIISKKDFDENYNNSVKKNPVEELRKWRAGLSKDELLVLAEAGEEYNRILEENRNAERLDFGRENSWG